MLIQILFKLFRQLKAFHEWNAGANCSTEVFVLGAEEHVQMIFLDFEAVLKELDRSCTRSDLANITDLRREGFKRTHQAHRIVHHDLHASGPPKPAGVRRMSRKAFSIEHRHNMILAGHTCRCQW